MVQNGGDLVGVFGQRRLLVQRVVCEGEVEVISLRRDQVFGRVAVPDEGKRDDGPGRLNAGSEIPEGEDDEEYAVCEEDGMCATQAKGQ